MEEEDAGNKYAWGKRSIPFVRLPLTNIFSSFFLSVFSSLSPCAHRTLPASPNGNACLDDVIQDRNTIRGEPVVR